MKILKLTVFALTLLAMGLAKADERYILELESLLNSLDHKDYTRPQLTLRLADVYFDEATALSSQNFDNQQEQALKVKKYRLKSVSLYEDSLSGLGGLFSIPNDNQKGKIRFQLSRLYSDLGRDAEAEKIWIALSNQNALTDLKRESSLRLAEKYELTGKEKDLTEAERLYKVALSLCTNQDVCSYSHYRLAWIYHKRNQHIEAVSEIEKSLWDSKGQIREEALRDYLSFLSQVPGDGQEALSKIEEINRKIQRPSVILDMAELFLAAGNKPAGIYVLESYNRKFPQVKNSARLLEEYYGVRNWDKFQSLLEISLMNAQQGLLSASTDVEAEKILKRLSVQLDGERASRPEKAPDFKKSVLLYTLLFPNRLTERKQMIDGWVEAETDVQHKVAQLATWIKEENKNQRVAEEIRLRKLRAAIAQKAEVFEIVAEESEALQKLASKQEDKDEFLYQQAHALYKLKNQEGALKLFQKLSEPQDRLTSWGLQSEHLALDILNTQKAYAQVVTQAQKWTSHSRFQDWVKFNPTKTSELLELKKIEEEALFESAIQQGETPEALAIFSNYCQAGKIVDKSCKNTEILAIKLKDQKNLLMVLQKLGKNQELAAEYEASGRFADAAKTISPKLNDPQSTIADYLKIALLYELGDRTLERDEVLKKLLAKWIKLKSQVPEEDLLYETFKDAKFLNLESLKWPWGKDNHLRLVDYLEAQKMGNAETKNIILNSCDNLGQSWKRLTLENLKDLDAKQRKIQFYGKAGKQKFENRLAQLRNLVTKSECYLQGADNGQRVRIAALVAKAESDLATEIENSPLPKELDQESIDILKKSLAQMSEPFTQRAQEFLKIAQEHLEKISDVTEKNTLNEQLAKQSSELFSVPVIQEAKILSQNLAERTSALDEISRDPTKISALESLKNYYQNRGQKRLGAYFQGRADQAKYGGAK